MNDLLSVQLNGIPNPFDFANPISNKQLFVGRDEELKDIRYYLDHARNADRCINLALLGERAAGKTSLLNIIELEAIERGLVPVRIDLNEADVATQFDFWFKLVDALFNRVVTEGAADGSGEVFGGVAGKTYDTYLDLISTYEVPENKAFCPLVFPLQFAKARSAGSLSPSVSDQILKRDLQRVAKELGRPIVLLIDECNILSAHRELLEMVRNTFMNLPGYMLVFTGTPDLFPVMDDVFSPIVRQFKRIEVAPFSSIEETRKGVLEPLKSVSQQHLFEIDTDVEIENLPQGFYKHFTGDLLDLHALTGGRPYEIQLVCHFMFRRIQLGNGRKMRLSLEVLEDVLAELRKNQDIDARPIISAVRALDTEDLRRLEVMLQSGGKIPVSQLIVSAIATMGTSDSVAILNDAFRRFVDCGILADVQGCARFRGDDFDRIVCKYAARQRGVQLSFRLKSFGAYIEKRLLELQDDVALNGGLPEETKQEWLHSICDSFVDGPVGTNELSKEWDDIADGDSILDVCGRVSGLSFELYEKFVAVGEESLKDGIVLMRVDAGGEGAKYTGYFCRVKGYCRGGEVAGWLSRVEELSRRLSALGCSFSLSSRECTGTTGEMLFSLILDSGEQSVMRNVGGLHCSYACDAYLIESDKAKALDHARRAAPVVHILSNNDANNIGYVLLAGGEVQMAARAFEALIERAPEYSLARYNLGLVRLLQGNKAEAIRLFDEVCVLESEHPFGDLSVLLVPRLDRGAIVLDDRWPETSQSDEQVELLLLECAEQARQFSGSLVS